MTYIGRILLAIARVIVWILFPYEVRGREHIPPHKENQRLIVYANHVSLVDPVFLLLIFPQHIHFMAKQESFRTAIGRLVLGRMLGAFPVNRGKGDVGALKTAISIVEDGRVLGIFPEGTRSKTGEIGQFKSGAAFIVSHTGADVLPIAICPSGGQLRPFRKTVVCIGECVPFAALPIGDAEKPNIRAVTRQLAGYVRALQNELNRRIPF